MTVVDSLGKRRMRSNQTVPSTSALLVLALALSGCATPAAADGGMVLSGIYTSVALTVTASILPVTPSATSAATSTPSPTYNSPESVSTTPKSSTEATYAGSYSYASGCNNAAYVRDVTIEDGTVLAPGGVFTKTWTLSNTGSCTWSKHFLVVFDNGDGMDGSGTEIGHKVEPGESAEVSVVLTAPDDEGTYTGYWQLANTSGIAFGERIYVQIVVSDQAATSTPSSSPTPRSGTTTLEPQTRTPTAISASATATLAPRTSTSTPIFVTVTATPYPTYTPTDIPSAIPTCTPEDVPATNTPIY
jgi:hypothetical protein